MVFYVPRWVRSLIGATCLLGLLTAFAVALAPAASAHAVLEATTPSAGETVATAAQVRQVELRFDEPVSITLGSVKVLAADGTRVDLGQVSHPGGDGHRVAVAVRSSLSVGSYLVVWRVVSADSHPVDGSFTFSIGHAGAVAAAVSSSGSKPVAVVLAALRMLTYCGVLALFGGLVFAGACWPGGGDNRRLRFILVLASAVAGVATVCGIGVQAAQDIGAGLSSALDGAAIRQLLGTTFGHAHVARVGLLVAIGAALLVARRRGWTPPLQIATLAAGVAVLATLALDGHGGVDGLLALRTAVDVVHLAAAGAWLGGLAVLVTAVLPLARAGHARADWETSAVAVAAGTWEWAGEEATASPGAAAGTGDPQQRVTMVEPTDVAGTRRDTGDGDWAGVLRRFSALAMACVLVLVVTGVVQAWHQVGSVHALTDTTYGKLLVAKVLLLVVVIAIAAVSRNAVHSRLGSANPGWGVLTRSVVGELVVAVAILAVTSVLVATTPARVAFRPSQATTARLGPDTVQLSAIPAGTDTLQMHFYVFGADGLPTDVIRLIAVADQGAGGIGPVTIPVVAAGTGHFVAGQVLLPHAGTWTVQIRVQVSEFDEYAASIAVTVR